MLSGGAPSAARGAATAAVGTVVVALVALPVLRLAQILWEETDGDPLRALGSPGLGEAARNTVVLAVAVTLAASRKDDGSPPIERSA